MNIVVPIVRPLVAGIVRPLCPFYGASSALAASLLAEDGSFLLAEDGSRILLED